MASAHEELRSSLERGTGRAMLILRAAPDDQELASALLHACTHNLVFDTQCEAARAPYLRRLILATGRADAFRRDLAAHLGADAPEGEAKDLGQVFELLCLLAADGPTFDRRVLWDFLARTDFDTAGFGCADALVRLDGLPALLHCVERFRDEYAEWIWELESLLFTLRERDGEAIANEAVETARHASPSLDHLLSLVRKCEGSRSPRPEGPVDYQSTRSCRQT